ncbi:hypothetical protein ACJJTC_005135 [Scirpophaga incertulas]
MHESLRRLASEEVMVERGDMRRVRVELLDGDHVSVDVHRRANGGDLLDKVCDNLDIVEKDFFGLLHLQRGDPRVWLDLNRRLSKTFRNEPWDVRLAVKFYPPEPSEVKDDNTRYQLSLAVRRDLLEGRLQCSNITHALLASYVLQAELGDREGPTSLSSIRAVPLHAINEEFEAQVDELYAKHKGQTPAEAELNYLDNAKKLSLYGSELHCVRDSEEVDLVLAVNSHGISIYRDGVLMNRIPWAKISKISYNKREFRLRLRPSECDEFETHVSFKLSSTRACKKLWRCSVEHHMFFRRWEPVPVEVIPGLRRLGLRRLSCRRTLRQIRDSNECAPVA